MRVKLTNPSATVNFAVSSRLSYAMLSFFSLSWCPCLIIISGMKCDALPVHLVGAGCGGSAGRKGGYNHQGFWEDANCVGMTVVRDKFNKLCCVSCHSATGVGMGFVGRRDIDSASNREARGGQ